jgi:hypothetical protein
MAVAIKAASSVQLQTSWKSCAKLDTTANSPKRRIDGRYQRVSGHQLEEKGPAAPRDAALAAMRSSSLAVITITKVQEFAPQLETSRVGHIHIYDPAIGTSRRLPPGSC